MNLKELLILAGFVMMEWWLYVVWYAHAVDAKMLHETIMVRYQVGARAMALSKLKDYTP